MIIPCTSSYNIEEGVLVGVDRRSLLLLLVLLLAHLTPTVGYKFFQSLQLMNQAMLNFDKIYLSVFVPTLIELIVRFLSNVVELYCQKRTVGGGRLWISLVIGVEWFLRTASGSDKFSIKLVWGGAGGSENNPPRPPPLTHLTVHPCLHYCVNENF